MPLYVMYSIDFIYFIQFLKTKVHGLGVPVNPSKAFKDEKIAEKKIASHN